LKVEVNLLRSMLRSKLELKSIRMSEENLKFHIQKDDFFGTLATVLDLHRQIVEKNGNIIQSEFLENVNENLLYLQKHYKITKKRKPLFYSGNSQT